MKAKKFLTAEQQKMLAGMIAEAEKATSGEIRIHIEDRCSGDPVERAASVLHYLGMDRTAQRNGVVIYLACESKVFAIAGDEGINRTVPAGFWDGICASMAAHFRKGKFAEGLAEAVRSVGQQLMEFFPYTEGDVNEQPDEISFGTDNTKEDA